MIFFSPAGGDQVSTGSAAFFSVNPSRRTVFL